jgi:hypothetical protein
MSLKLKILGIGVLAVVATSAFAVMNASATVTGHFTHEGPLTTATIVGNETGVHSAHYLQFQGTEQTGTNSGAAIVCTSATYHGVAAAKTVTELTVTPSYTGCATTTGSTWGEVSVTMNGCNYIFYSNSAASTHTPTAHATVTVNCPAGKAIEIHHPNCTITVPHQSLKGVTYTTTVENKHSLTVNVTISHIAAEYHGGFCIFLGTNHIFDMNGAVKVRAQVSATNPEQVPITAT